MKKTEKGITLIALILTIVILLILAIVAINSITNDGLLGKAENVTGAYNNSVINEQEVLEKYEVLLKLTVAKVKNEVISTESNTEVVDAYGNKIVVPAGFKIVVNDDTNNADTVTKGIVIEDCTEAETKGSQFVWIPVGKIYTDTERTEANAKTITLGRYVFDSNGNIDTSLSKTNPSDELKVSSTSSYSLTEGLKDSTTSNAHARDIEAFIESAKTNGGYYIGRYEARTDNTKARKQTSGTTSKVTSIKKNMVYNYVTQAQASSLAQGMYADGYLGGTFSSDLINSYAWSTAIVFLQEFDNRSKKKKTTPYSIYHPDMFLTAAGADTGDVICNVYDMAGNCLEWSTETSSNEEKPCVTYGGTSNITNSSARSRVAWSTEDGVTNQRSCFRTIIYVAL